jgi:phospholipid/cholesterol/gamma-HCH transport system substrate-binding protein
MHEHGGHGRLAWKDVIPGLLILGAVLVISLFTFFGDAVRRAKAEGPRITVLAPEVAGLERGSVVWLAGKPSGRVLSVHFREPGGPIGERVSIEAVLLREAMPFLGEDAHVTIGSASLLRPSVVKIAPGSEHALPLGDGDTLRVVSRLDIESFRTMADSVRIAIRDVADGASELREQVTGGNGSAARFLAHRGSVAQVDSTRSRIDRLRLAWQQGGGLARLVREDSVRASATRAMATLRDLTDPANRPAAIDSLVGVGETFRQIENRARELGAGIERAEGTAGRALKDSALRLSADRTRAALDSLTSELGTNPLAWLRFQLF